LTDRTIRLVCRGAFAGEVAEDLVPALTAAGYAVTTEDEAAIGLLVADQDDPEVTARQDSWRAAGIASLVIVQSCPDVRVGPLDVPGTELCGLCYRRRARQNGAAVPTLPDTVDFSVGVSGFAPPVTALLATLAVDRLAVLDGAPDAAVNEVTVVNTASVLTRTSPVLPVNLCPACSGQKPIGVLSGGQPMFPALAAVTR
jgi:bacteriocin biosynthesis cyclodehydratase domain-containing protein